MTLAAQITKANLPEFTSGTYSADFEKVAFSLKNKGDISKPFQTSYGYHIVKLLEAKPVITRFERCCKSCCSAG